MASRWSCAYETPSSRLSSAAFAIGRASVGTRPVAVAVPAYGFGFTNRPPASLDSDKSAADLTYFCAGEPPLGAMMTRHVRSRLKSVRGCEFLGKAERPGHVWVYKTGMQSWGLNATQSLWRYVDAPAASTVGANKTGRRGLWSSAKPRTATLFQGT